MNTTAKFLNEHYYHIYNRTNNKEKLFPSKENRRFFLQRYHFYLGSFLTIHAYALMSNHFHFSVKIRNSDQIADHLNSLPLEYRTNVIKRFLELDEKELGTNDLIISQHRRFFISYAQAINKRYNRQGNLFNAKFKRSLFIPEEKFMNLQYYIHHNARRHGLVQDFKDYPYTSYFDIMNKDSSFIEVKEILERFSSIKEFEKYHEELRNPIA